MSDTESSERKIHSQSHVWEVLLAALLIAAACVINYRYLVYETNDRYPEMLAPMLSVFGIQTETAADIPRVAVYHSRATDAYFQSQNVAYDNYLLPWMNRLREMGFRPDRVDSIDELLDYDLAILPFTVAVGNYEAEWLKEYVAGGGSLFLTGPVGSRDANGNWRDQPVFGDLGDLRFVGNANPSPSGPARLRLQKDLPVSPQWTQRGSLAVPTYHQVLVARPLGPRMTAVATTPWFFDDERSEDMMALGYGRYLKGKIAWSGFSIGAVSPNDKTAERVLRELFANLVVWLLELPTVGTEVWPEDADRAVGLMLEVTPENADAIASRAEIWDVPVSLLVHPLDLRELARNQRLRALSAEWIVSVDETYREAINAPVRDWLPTLRGRYENALQREIKGVRLEGLPPRQVAQTVIEAGFSYLVAPPTGEIREFPEIYASDRKLGPLESPTELALAPVREALPDGIEKRGCLLILLDDEKLENPPDWLRKKGRFPRNSWFATGGSIVEWRTTRNALAMGVEYLPGDALRIRISNGAYETLRDFPFSIDFHHVYQNVAVWPKAVGLQPPREEAAPDSFRRYVVPELKPGHTVEYVFTPE